jgi:ABC-type transport system involved in multi-copper enzyme maturation permease subunit
MIWMAWRQFRAQALVAFGALAALAIYTVVLGFQIRHSYSGDLAGCKVSGNCSGVLSQFEGQYSTTLGLLGDLLIAVPGVIGVFWGAPLVTRELETGTHRLVWNQSVTRGRWLAVKLMLIGLASVVLAGLFSLLLTWCASPYDAAEDNRFSPLLFDSRNITPLGYAAFGFLLGTSLGLLIRRTVPAMAVTLAVFAGLQILVPSVIRPHLVSPDTITLPINAATIGESNGIGELGGSSAVTVIGLKLPDAWVVSSSDVLTANDQTVSPNDVAQCMQHDTSQNIANCYAAKNLHMQVSYQPDSRYWTFQWYETASFAALSVLLSVLCFWRIRRGRLS